MEHVMLIRFGAFLVLFTGLALAESLAPRRWRSMSRRIRWFPNLGMLALNPLAVALVFPILPIGLAVYVTEQNWGLLSHPGVPYWLKVVVGVVMLDFAVYIQHVLFHAIPTLWRLHMVHHADLDFDLTTGVRFHPGEILISLVIKMSVVAALGAPPLAVLIFEVALNGTSMFNHSNLNIPKKIDRVLRWMVVTPDMHRVHHSVIIRETNSNYGFNLPWWDRLLATYKDQPAKGHRDMTIGLSWYRDSKKLTLPRLLILPIVGDPGRVPINRH
ncbi:MAG: sterol desaturase family protein [Desulfohalobiaceae bacterium]|nr:sterol desaturase family protein [Desulfohalobiaceae bacterium]